MKERPILFSAPMVRAILEGRKTQTRRVMCKPADNESLWQPVPEWDEESSTAKFFAGGELMGSRNCPYGKPGDRLWVRENFCHCYAGENGEAYQIIYEEGARKTFCENAGVEAEKLDWLERGINVHGERSRPSIHMPRWASRITLEVVSVRVELLQVISRGDALAEGCPFPNMANGPDPRQWFADLWELINGPDSWQANPWVWVVEFRRLP